MTLKRERDAQRDFRVHVNAAPLKLNAVVARIDLERDFRVHVNAAPLKLSSSSTLGKLRPNFRVHVNAAPLKQNQLAAIAYFHVPLPRSRERGSIEARRNASPADPGSVTSAFT